MQDQSQERQTIEKNNSILDRSILHLKVTTILSNIHPHFLLPSKSHHNHTIIISVTKKPLCRNHAFSEFTIICLPSHTDVFSHIGIIEIQGKKKNNLQLSLRQSNSTMWSLEKTSILFTYLMSSNAWVFHHYLTLNTFKIISLTLQNVIFELSSYFCQWYYFHIS